MSVQQERVAEFRRLHESGCFVMPNPWDVGSAKVLQQMGFPALATTSAGLAWTLGRADNHITLEQSLDHLQAIADAVTVPVNADFEGGFAVEPEQVARERQPCGGHRCRRALDRGLDAATRPAPVRVRAGRRPDPGRAPGDRRQWHRRRADRSVGGVRRRAARHRRDRPQAARVRRGRRRLPLRPPHHHRRPGHRRRRGRGAQARQPADQRPLHHRRARPQALGVRRISVGGTLARTAWGGFLAAAQEIADAGTFTRFDELPNVEGLLGSP